MVLYSSGSPVANGDEISGIKTISKESYRIRIGIITKPNPGDFIGATIANSYDVTVTHQETTDGAYSLMMNNRTIPGPPVPTEVVHGTSDYNELYKIISSMP